MICPTCQRAFYDDPTMPGCPHCWDDEQAEIDRANTEAGILCAAINDAAGESWPDKFGGTGRTAHDYQLVGPDKVDILIRVRASLGTASKAEVAAELIHMSVGLLSTGLAGVGQTRANQLVAKAAAYHEDGTDELARLPQAKVG